MTGHTLSIRMDVTLRNASAQRGRPGELLSREQTLRPGQRGRPGSSRQPGTSSQSDSEHLSATASSKDSHLAKRLSSTPKITRRRRMILHRQHARLRRSGASFCSSCSVATQDDSTLPVAALRLEQSQRHRLQSGPRCRVGFCGFRQSWNQFSSVSFPNISSGVQMIGIGIPNRVSTSWMRGRIFAFAMCLQFHVSRYCIRWWATAAM